MDRSLQSGRGRSGEGQPTHSGPNRRRPVPSPDTVGNTDPVERVTGHDQPRMGGPAVRRITRDAVEMAESVPGHRPRMSSHLHEERVAERAQQVA